MESKLFEQILKETHEDFYLMTEEENLRENVRLQEMGVTFRKHQSGLPVHLFLDDSQTYLQGGHSKRIKFQIDKGDHPNTRTMLPMTIMEEPPRIPLDNPKHKLSSKEIKQIQDFVRNNRELLSQPADAEIDIFEFKERMRRN